MKIIYRGTKTGRGVYVKCNKQGRVLRRGGYIPLLLSKNLGSSDVTLKVGGDVNSDNTIVGGTMSKPHLDRIMRKVQNIKF